MLDAPDAPLSPPWLPEKPGCILVCESGDSLCGWLMALPTHRLPGRGCLCNIWVDPAYRNQGVASSLIQSAVEWASSHNFTSLELWVRESNTRARRLYHTLGFRESGWLRAGDEPDADPCVHMIRPAPAPASLTAAA